MNPLSSPGVEPVATTWAGATVEQPLSGFLDRAMGPLKRHLRDSCAGLGAHLDRFQDVVDTAVGTVVRGGSRWRPLLTLAAAEACGGCRDDALDAAVAVELTHTASLVLDDLPCMDDSAQRRGRPATHRLVGPAGAILLSVGLLARSSELLARDRERGGELCGDWGRTVGLLGMAGGQAVDVASPGKVVGAARRLHREKSAALPAFALVAGARTARAPEPVRTELRAFGRGLGWAYQLLDDLQDRREDGFHGRAPGGRRPLHQSRRIMNQAYERLRGVPGLEPEGVEIMVALAGRVVIPERESGSAGALESPSRRC